MKTREVLHFVQDDDTIARNWEKQAPRFPCLGGSLDLPKCDERKYSVSNRSISGSKNDLLPAAKLTVNNAPIY